MPPTIGSLAQGRTQAGPRTVDEATKQEVLVASVVVIKTDITEGPGIVEDELGSLSLDIRSTGEGPLAVFRDGRRVDGRWSRQETDMFTFRDASGPAILLRPGLAWVHVVPSGWEIG